jgi:REP element-mobilizing transposase RayT
LPGRIYLITRRCSRRQFILRPGKRSNQAILYCLAEAAAHTGVEVLWFFAMSNHIHYGIYDRDGAYPLFLRRFHRNVAKVLNCHWGRWGNLFEAEQTSVVRPLDEEAIFAAMIYSLTNAVKDQLVARAREWPGVSSLAAQLEDTEIVVRRPDWFFAEGTSMPEEVSIRFARPPGFGHLSHKQWTDRIQKAIRRVERDALEKRRKADEPEDRRVLGVGRIRAQSCYDYPKGHEPRRQISPRVKATSKWRRIEAIRQDKEWLAAYAAALESYRAGNTRAVFPPGTWQLYEDGHVFRHAA